MLRSVRRSWWCASSIAPGRAGPNDPVLVLLRVAASGRPAVPGDCHCESNMQPATTFAWFEAAGTRTPSCTIVSPGHLRKGGFVFEEHPFDSHQPASAGPVASGRPPHSTTRAGRDSRSATCAGMAFQGKIPALSEWVHSCITAPLRTGHSEQ